MGAPQWVALAVAYVVAGGGWFLALRFLPGLWPRGPGQAFARPWREFGYALLAVAGVLVMGQLYQRDLLLPGAWSITRDTANQVLLYSPMLLLLVVRRHSLQTAWVPTSRVVSRLAVGMVLALLALAAFAWVRTGLDRWPALVTHVYRPGHTHYAVHVFLEDVSVAILLVRLGAALGRRWLAPLLVAFLFAAGHIPGALTDGATMTDLLPLVVDFLLAAAVLQIVQRSADVWWLWCVHFAMDMTQFFPGSPAP